MQTQTCTEVTSTFTMVRKIRAKAWIRSDWCSLELPHRNLSAEGLSLSFHTQLDRFLLNHRFQKIVYKSIFFVSSPSQHWWLVIEGNILSAIGVYTIHTHTNSLSITALATISHSTNVHSAHISWSANILMNISLFAFARFSFLNLPTWSASTAGQFLIFSVMEVSSYINAIVHLLVACWQRIHHNFIIIILNG